MDKPIRVGKGKKGSYIPKELDDPQGIWMQLPKQAGRRTFTYGHKYASLSCSQTDCRRAAR